MINWLKLVTTLFHTMIRGKSVFSIKNTLFKVNKNLINEEFDIVIYIPSAVDSLYQINQWLQPFYELNKKHKVVILARRISTFSALSSKIILPIFYIQDSSSLKNLYENKKPSVIIYLNNSLKNNQSLLYKKGYHVYVNHGESEKECMSSNQSKSYDYVLTTGQRGIDRYTENLLNFNEKNCLIVGRPQLDHIKPKSINNPNNKKIIMYAPTWEAHHPEMDYCSLEKYGLNIINAIIESTQLILIYKPHPSIGTIRKSVSTVNKKIISIINKNDNAYYFERNNIIDLFDCTDFAIFDNSSVMIDFLSFNKPGAYVNIRSDIQSNKIKEAYYELDYTARNMIDVIIEILLNDTKAKQRKKVKEYYLGEYTTMESTEAFVRTIVDLVKDRNKKIKTKIYSE